MRTKMVYFAHHSRGGFPLKLSTLSLALALSGPVAAATLTNRSIATVNGEVILLSEYEKNWQAFLEQQKDSVSPEKMTDEWKKESREKLLDQMIANRALLQQAKKKKIRVNQSEFENGVLQVKARFLPEAVQKELQTVLLRQMAAAGPNASESALDFPGAWEELEKSNPAAIKAAEAGFLDELKKEGIDRKKFEERIKDQLSVNEMSKEAVRARTTPPTDEDVKALFDKVQLKMQGQPVPGAAGEAERDLESMAKFYTQQTGERVRARHILVSVTGESGAPTGWGQATPEQKARARKKILDLRKRLQKKGADFGELASQVSDDKGSAVNGGDLGFFTRGPMVPAFEETAFNLDVGKVSDVVETPFGLHLITVDEKKAAVKFRFEDVEDDMKEYLFRSGQQRAFEEYMAEARKAAQVKITLPTAKK